MAAVRINGQEVHAARVRSTFFTFFFYFYRNSFTTFTLFSLSFFPCAPWRISSQLFRCVCVCVRPCPYACPVWFYALARRFDAFPCHRDLSELNCFYCPEISNRLFGFFVPFLSPALLSLLGPNNDAL